MSDLESEAVRVMWPFSWDCEDEQHLLLCLNDLLLFRLRLKKIL